MSDGPSIARAHGYTATEKLAGSRRKGKQRASELLPRKRKRSPDDDETPEPAKRGRPKGAGNYSIDNLNALLDATEKELPLGHRGWQVIHRQFTRWARSRGRPERELKSLETKYKQACYLFIHSILVSHLISISW